MDFEPLKLLNSLRPSQEIDVDGDGLGTGVGGIQIKLGLCLFLTPKRGHRDWSNLRTLMHSDTPPSTSMVSFRTVVTSTSLVVGLIFATRTYLVPFFFFF